jgi:hypothetical protein
VPEELSVKIEKVASKIFAILLLANNVHIIGDMLECGLQDQHLPLSLGQGENTLESGDGAVFRPFKSRWSGRISRGIEAFLEKQWIVGPPILDDSGEHRKFDPKRTLPFLERLEPLGTAAKQVFDCTIHPGHFRTVDNMTQLWQSNDDTVTEV